MSTSPTLYVLNSLNEFEHARHHGLLTRFELPIRIHVVNSANMVDQMKDPKLFNTEALPEGLALDPVYIHGEDLGEGPITDDKLGRLQYCFPEAFKVIQLDGDEHPLNFAILAFVLALPADWPIVIYWS